jgi:hypothetical protein
VCGHTRRESSRLSSPLTYVNTSRHASLYFDSILHVSTPHPPRTISPCDLRHHNQPTLPWLPSDQTNSVDAIRVALAPMLAMVGCDACARARQPASQLAERLTKLLIACTPPPIQNHNRRCRVHGTRDSEGLCRGASPPPRAARSRGGVWPSVGARSSRHGW